MTARMSQSFHHAYSTTNENEAEPAAIEMSAVAKSRLRRYTFEDDSRTSQADITFSRTPVVGAKSISTV